jgi:hypothetical protein
VAHAEKPTAAVPERRRKHCGGRQQQAQQAHDGGCQEPQADPAQQRQHAQHAQADEQKPHRSRPCLMFGPKFSLRGRGTLAIGGFVRPAQNAQQ